MTRPLLLALALTLPAALPAQRAAAQAAAGAPTPVLGEVSGAFMALSVANLQASTAWYRDKLGLRVTMEAPRQNGAAVVVLEGGGLTVELVELEAAQPRPGADTQGRGPELVHGFFKAGVRVANLTETLDRLRARGVAVAYGPFPARDRQPANAIIRDNAGNLIQLFER